MNEYGFTDLSVRFINELSNKTDVDRSKQRLRYFRIMNHYRSKGRPIYFMDETWVVGGMTSPHGWVQLNEDNTIKKSYTNGHMFPTTRAVVIGIGGENGFVAPPLVFTTGSAKQREEYEHKAYELQRKEQEKQEKQQREQLPFADLVASAVSAASGVRYVLPPHLQLLDQRSSSSSSSSSSSLTSYNSLDGALIAGQDNVPMAVVEPENNSTDYHGMMNTDTFKLWLLSMLPLLPPNAAIVLDRATYHTSRDKTRRNALLLSTSNKEEYINWLIENCVVAGVIDEKKMKDDKKEHRAKNKENKNRSDDDDDEIVPNELPHFSEWYCENGVHRELTQEEWKLYNKENIVTIDKNYVKENGLYPKSVAEVTVEDYNASNNTNIRLVYLPVKHCVFNPIELLWAILKPQVCRMTKNSKIKDTINHFNKVCNDGEAESYWHNSFSHCLKVEQEYMQNDLKSELYTQADLDVPWRDEEHSINDFLDDLVED